MTYSLYFYRADGSLKLSTNFFVGEDEVFSDALADALYISRNFTRFTGIGGKNSLEAAKLFSLIAALNLCA